MENKTIFKGWEHVINYVGDLNALDNWNIWAEKKTGRSSCIIRCVSRHREP